MAPKRRLSRSNFHSIYILLVACALLLSSCGLPGTGLSTVFTPVPPSPTPQAPLASPTLLPPSSTPGTLLDTATALPPSPTPPPTAVPPTLTAQFTATPAAPTGSISLAPGTTAGVVAGTIQPGQVATYTLGALQSQPLTLLMDSPRNDVTLGVSDPNQNVLLDPGTRISAWQLVLPSTGLYTIQVAGGTQAESYTLTVKLPEVVNFAPGATSATLDGSTVNGYLYSYSLACSAGQTMTASLNVPSSTATLDVYGISSGTFLNPSAQANTWSGTLPQTQDYVIEVIPTNGLVVNYSLTVSVTSGTAATSYTVGNIAFAKGATSATIKGTVLPGQEVSYTLAGEYAQPLILVLESPKRDATLGVYEPDGSVLLSPAKKWSNWQWQLPAAEVYTIKVVGGVTTDDYTLTVKLPQLVYFPKGSSSITLNGSTLGGMLVSYAFRCGAGQVMTATLNTPATKAFLDIFGVATGSLLSYTDHATTWTGTLPQTQDYVVEVIPRGGIWVSYSLTVTIH